MSASSFDAKICDEFGNYVKSDALSYMSKYRTDFATQFTVDEAELVADKQLSYYMQAGRQLGKTNMMKNLVNENIDSMLTEYARGAEKSSMEQWTTTTGTNSGNVWYPSTYPQPYSSPDFSPYSVPSITVTYPEKEEEEKKMYDEPCACVANEDERHCPLCDAKMSSKSVESWYEKRGKKKNPWKEWKSYTCYTFECGTMKYEGDWDDRRVVMGDECVLLPG